jgi:hypothetical protein
MYEFDVDYFEIYEEDWEAFEEGLAAELEETSKELDKMLDNLR